MYLRTNTDVIFQPKTTKEKENTNNEMIERLQNVFSDRACPLIQFQREIPPFHSDFHSDNVVRLGKLART